jgi:hypothetical protein
MACASITYIRLAVLGRILRRIKSRFSAARSTRLLYHKCAWSARGERGMAKFNIEVNLEWLGEDGNLDSALKDEIVNSIVSKISKEATTDIEANVNKLVSDKVNEAVGQKLNEVLEDFLNKPRTITDHWGDVKEKNVTVVEMLKKACDEFMEGKVDKEGRPCNSGYGETKKRIDYIIEKNIDYSLKASIEKAAAAIKTGLQNYVDTTIKTQIGENVAKIIGLNGITKAMGK